jgi:ATP-binding cassette subfamily B protein
LEIHEFAGMSVAPAAKKNLFDLALLRRVFGYTAPYRDKFIISVVLSVLLALLSPIRPMLVNYSISHIVGDVHSTRNMVLDLLFRITLLQVILLVVETLLRFWFTYLTAWLGQTVVRDLRIKVYQKVIGLNLTQFDTTPIGTLTTRTINDIEAINDIFSEGLVPIIADLLSIVAILAAMFWTDWRLTLICLIPFPLLILATYYFKESVNRSFIRVRNAVAALNAFVQEHITGMQVVQAFVAEDTEMAKFRDINREHRDANIKAIFAYSLFFPFVEIILAFSMGLLVWFAAIQALGLPPEKAAEISGIIVSFIIMLNLLFRPLRMIADKFNVLQMGMVASERVFKVLDNPDQISKEGSHSPEKVKGDVRFEGVWFAYKSDQYVLKDISFHIKPGETLAIVGHTGSGKTSIISLLNRLYAINKGSILVDDVAIEDYALHSLRSQIGVVLQDVFLFSGSILDNVTLRNTAISREEVEKVAKLIGIHEFINQLPGGYDYNVMERGGTLSMGQRQLLSFIRALLFDPSILILDEATSSVDTQSEQLIQRAIETMISGRTSIVIAHRLSTIRKASKILVLENGVVMENGTHDELMAKGGFYADLYNLQFNRHTPHVVQKK